MQNLSTRDQKVLLSEMYDKNNLAKNDKVNPNYTYIVIGALYIDLDRIFGAENWDWIVKQSFLDGEAYHTTGDLVVRFADGEVKTVSGQGAAGAKTGAQKAFPASGSFAFKNACQKLGEVFARSLRLDPDMTGKTRTPIDNFVSDAYVKKQAGIAANKQTVTKWLSEANKEKIEEMCKTRPEIAQKYYLAIEARLQALEGGAQ